MSEALELAKRVAKRKHPLAECEVCPLFEAKCTPSVLPPDATTAFVSRSPGKAESVFGKPFSGPSGVVLDHLLAKHGVKREEIITTNVVLCRSDDPPLEAIKACAPRLEAEIADCELVIAGGAEATRLLTKRGSLNTARGFRHHRNSTTGLAQSVVATNNPAMVIRNSDSFPDMLKDFQLAFNPLPPPVFPEVEVIDNPDQARSVLGKWLTTDFGVLASDLEWSGDEIYCAGFSRSGRKSVVFGHRALKDETAFDQLRSFYARRDIRFVWHNGKSDTKVLRNNGIEGRVDDDTFILSYLLDERPGVHALEYLLMSEFGWPDYEPYAVKQFKKTGVIDNKDLPALYKYNGWDTAGTKQLFDTYVPRVKEEGLWDLYRDKYIPASEAFLNIERRGFHYDVEAAANLNEREVLPRLWSLADELRRISHRPLLNPRSSVQMKAIYYTQYELKHGLRDIGAKKLKTSTGSEVRQEILDGRFECKAGLRDEVVKFADTHRIYAKIEKQRGTYIEGLIQKALNGGKIYTTFNLCGTVSGRPSSKEPNLQNITREGVEGIEGIRTLFVPSPGNVILAADYSQAELRTCAVVSGDQELLAIYRDSRRSLHRERAAKFYGPEYTKEQYVKSKNINFGVTYGQSAFAFAQMYHMPQREAQDYVDDWWRQFPTLKRWTLEQAKLAETDGVIQSPFGHKRRFHLITSENIDSVHREAVNFVPQNVAVWFTICSIIELDRARVPVVTTVHDSIVVDCPRDSVREVAQLMKTTMEAQPNKHLGWDLPVLVDLSVGDNWGEMEELEL